MGTKHRRWCVLGLKQLIFAIVVLFLAQMWRLTFENGEGHRQYRQKMFSSIKWVNPHSLGTGFDTQRGRTLCREINRISGIDRDSIANLGDLFRIGARREILGAVVSERWEAKSRYQRLKVSWTGPSTSEIESVRNQYEKLYGPLKDSAILGLTLELCAAYTN